MKVCDLLGEEVERGFKPLCSGVLSDCRVHQIELLEDCFRHALLDIDLQFVPYSQI